VTAVRGLREPLAAFAAVTALTGVVGAVGAAVPIVRENLHVLVAILFFYAPAIAARRAGREFDYRAAGLRLDPLGLNLAVVGLTVLVTFPLFAIGFFVFYGQVCGGGGEGLFPGMGGLCRRWVGWAAGDLRLPPGFALLAFFQLLVVAVPEELFFRGYLMERLEQRWPARRQILGAPVGLALVVSSALFAIGHLAVIPNPQRLAVFFPALLFGWMRARTGSIAAGAAYHALCNLVADVLHTSYFGG
jgi:membrane protease YdiL (CAAX protease family)